ncbi:tyrosine-protein phosphatase 10D-like isoform X2 [Tachypleus tridentatus]|uniref:tyrosine-protein phosphatase 10D-like isoform X2 n=1 Tax=Tachypleus tridentatus TaxID=6853 RepID=UPI003FD325CB
MLQHKSPIKIITKVPLPPSDVTFDMKTLTPYSVDVMWSPPTLPSEFDHYQISMGLKNSVKKIVKKEEKRVARFIEGLEPGQTYEVDVKTISGSVASWPATDNVITRPLPVVHLFATVGNPGDILVEWQPNNKSIQDSFLVNYQETLTFSTDKKGVIIQETLYQINNLQPGKRYSINVAAMSKGVYSELTLIYQATRPTSPLIKIVEPVISGFNISWIADVISTQDSYVVEYIRNDTGHTNEEITNSHWLLLNNLYSGAVYEIKLYAQSYGVKSEPHSYFHTVYPKPPEKLQTMKASNSTIILTWIAPSNSLVGNYIVYYRPAYSNFLREVGIVNATSSEISNLVAGEWYIVRVTSVSNHVESKEVRELKQSTYPNSVKHVHYILDSYNVTFEWIAPQGKVDYYIIVYNTVPKPLSQISQQIFATETQQGEMVSVLVDKLKPGELYLVHFYAVSNNLQSEGFDIQMRTMPVIDSVLNIVTDKHETRTLMIKYTPTSTQNVIFDRYRFQLSDFTVPAQEKLHNDMNHIVIFDSLLPGHLYNITLWTVSGGVYSIPTHIQARLYPDHIKNISAVKITDISISLTWDVPNGEKDIYEVQYLDHKGILQWNMTALEQITCSNLHPHHNYTFSVTVISGYGTSTVRRSLPLSRTFQTLESVPGKVHLFKAIDIRPSSLTLQWSLSPHDQHGVLTGFQVTYFDKELLVVRRHVFKPTETIGTIYHLIPGKSYIFEIQALTRVGPGNKVIHKEVLPIWAPPSPPHSIFPIVIGQTSTTIHVRFHKKFFSNIHGPIVTYTLIVAEDTGKDSSSWKLPSWADIQTYYSWPPYQVTKPYYPFNDSEEENFVIGNMDCSGVTEYCNGPLKAGATYRIKLRAYTASRKFTDTVYSPAVQTDPDNTLLIVGILVPLSLLVVGAVIVIILCRHRLKPFIKKNADIYGRGDTLSVPDGEIISSRPIKLREFANHFRIMSADSDFQFSEEFELLKHVGREKPCSTAEVPVNRLKNRFTNILPYDHSRIKLLPTDDEEGSDYINANYVSGYNSPREFIVTQGPLHSTRNDFWRMVWEQNSSSIIMLTRCIEKGREKCDHYWPFDMQPIYFGDIQVTILNESQYSDWTVSEFQVSRSGQSRIVRHFHFTTWPDFGVPDPPQTLIKFVRAFREHQFPDNKPVIVHCSAGVGRSGTFIALDHILQCIKKCDSVDIFGLVYEMRKERVWMVQNEQQYICVHQCLLCVLEGKEDIIVAPNRPEVHDNHGFEGECNMLGYSRKGFNFNCYHWFCFPLSLCVFVEAQGTVSYIPTEINKIVNETHFKNAQNFFTTETKISSPKIKTMTAKFQNDYKERIQKNGIKYEPQDLVTKSTLKRYNLNHGLSKNKVFQDNFVTNAVSHASVAVGNEDILRTKSSFGIHKLGVVFSGTGNEINTSLDPNIDVLQKHLIEMKNTWNDDSTAKTNTSRSLMDTFNTSKKKNFTGRTSKKYKASVAFSFGRNKENSTEVKDSKEVIISPSFDIFKSKSSPSELQDTFNNFHFIKANNSHNLNTFKLVNSRNTSASDLPFEILNKSLNINIRFTTSDATNGNTSDRDIYIIITPHNNTNISVEINGAFTYKNSLNTLSIHLVIVLIIALIIVLIVVGLVASRVYEIWQRRHYCKMDFLIEGIYR